MPIGNKNSNSNKKLLAFKIKTKDAADKKVAPYFEIKEKDVAAGGKWVARKEGTTRVEGNIVKLELKTAEYDGNEYNVINIFMEDTEEGSTDLYLLDLRLNNLSGNIFNSLLALKNYNGVAISLYEKESNKDQKMYPNASVWQGKKLVKGLYSLDQIPKAKKVKIGKKEAIDSSERDDFFLAQLEKLSENIRMSKPAADDVKTPDAPEADTDEGTGENVPF